jgi:hypothetical protein
MSFGNLISTTSLGLTMNLETVTNIMKVEIRHNTVRGLGLTKKVHTQLVARDF